MSNISEQIAAFAPSMVAELPVMARVVEMLRENKAHLIPDLLAAWTVEDLDELEADVKRFHSAVSKGITTAFEEGVRAYPAVQESWEMIRDLTQAEVDTFCAYLEGCVIMNLRRKAPPLNGNPDGGAR